MELEITWKRAFRVWLAWFWRYLTAITVAAIILIILPFVIGPIVVPMMIKIGFRDEVIKSSGATFAYVGMGMAYFLAAVFPLKAILGKKFGGFRLVLLVDDKGE